MQIPYVMAIVLFFVPIASAQQGCCSWHGGISSCGTSGYYMCRDGSQSPTCRCAGGSTATPSSELPHVPTTPSVFQCPSGQTFDVFTNNCACPAGMEWTNNNCTCKKNFIFSENKTYCAPLPKNAHADNKSKNGWACDAGFSRQLNGCVSTAPSSTPKRGSIAGRPLRSR